VRYGIFGDVHSNLQALQAVLAALEAERVDRMICLGDLVGYGADPEPCLAIVRELDPYLVGGNHDWGVAGRLSLTYFNPVARAAIEWTRQSLPEETVAWLGSLEITGMAGDDIALAHSTVHDPQLFEYLVTPYDAYLSFRHLTTDLAFVGHSHVPATFFDGNPVTPVYESVVDLAGRRAIANVGSVGQPRDGIPDAAFGVYDEESGRLTIHRVTYDVEAAAARIREVGLPPILADRLHLGR
jgi:diadenosine tetraphosphatase ApaH/serine/threonine PP2A family protein phosphatase